MTAANPFKPTAGATPPQLIGRRPLLEAFQQSLEEGPGSPGRLTIFTGARGVGKTVMLNEVEDLALQQGWLAVNETATPGLVARLERHVHSLLATMSPPRRRRLTGVSLPFGLGSITTEPTPETSVALRTKLGQLLDDLRVTGSGLLLTIDEVHGTARGELREIGPIAQHLIREDREIAVVMAGLRLASPHC